VPRYFEIVLAFAGDSTISNGLLADPRGDIGDVDGTFLDVLEFFMVLYIQAPFVIVRQMMLCDSVGIRFKKMLPRARGRAPAGCARVRVHARTRVRTRVYHFMSNFV
jgi:hypothetical protein